MTFNLEPRLIATFNLSILRARSALTTTMSLTDEQLARFDRDGFAVLEAFLTEAECDSLRRRAFEIIAEADLSRHPTVTFNTRDNQQVGRGKDGSSCLRVASVHVLLHEYFCVLR